MEPIVTLRPRSMRSSWLHTGPWRTALGLLSSLVALAVIGATEDVMQQNQPPERMSLWRAPLAARVSVQVIAGLVLGAGTGYLGTVFGGWLVDPEPGGFGDIVAMLGGLLLGFPLGASIGIWLSGRLLGGQGALWRTLLGAYLGVGLGLLGVRLLIYGNTTVGWLLLIALSLLGACAGYYARRWRR